MGAAVGIDLGTTNTVVAAVRDGRAVTLADAAGRRLIPSIVSFHPGGGVLVGEAAKERRLIDPSQTIYSVKRLIGRSWSTPEVQAARARFPFELVEGAKNSTLVAARGETYALPEISAFVLRRAKAVAEEALGEPVDRAVITVPASFNDLQRASTKVAGKLAGLEVLRILNEPTAAALAYGQSGQQTERIAVYDLGGGTFDMTLLDLSGNVFEVLATSGDTALGGDDIDALLSGRLAEAIVRAHASDPRGDPGARARLRTHAERIKHELSERDEVSVTLRDLGSGQGGAPLAVPFRMTRKELERDVEPVIRRTLEVCRVALDTVGLEPGAFDRVILVGGPTRMPIVKRSVEAFFRRAPEGRVNPDEVVALGAAIQAHALDRGRKKQARATLPPVLSPAAPPIALPPRLASEPRPAAAPAAVTPASPPSGGSSPASLPRSARSLTFDEPSALPPPRPKTEPYARFIPGAPDLPGPRAIEAQAPAPPAVPAAPAAPERNATRLAVPLLIDVTPLSLRVETVGGFCDVLIAANTAVPCDKSRVFLTATDGQTIVAVRVAQGESNRFADNTYLGELELSGIAPAARGETSIGVTFEIDADGILNVKARDVKSGRETKARLQLLGAETEPKDVDAMLRRQAARVVT